MTRFLLPALMFVAAVAIFFGYSMSAYDETMVKRAEVARYEEVLARFEELKTLRDSLRDTYNSFPTDEVAKLRDLLPDNLDTIRFALDLDGIARKNAVRIQDLKIGEGDENDEAPVEGEMKDESLSLGMATMEFSVEASYERVIAFLVDAERNLRLADVIKFEFAEPKEATGLPLYNVGVRMYWLK